MIRAKVREQAGIENPGGPDNGSDETDHPK